MTPFPSHGSRRPSDLNIEAYSMYCVCRMINDGTPMIQCSSCTEWYHMACCAVPSRFMTNKRLVQSNRTVHSLSYMHVHVADPHLCIRSSFPILLSNTIQAYRIIFIRYCRRCINTASNIGNHCNNLTSHLVKNKLNKCTNHMHIYMHAACVI